MNRNRNLFNFHQNILNAYVNRSEKTGIRRDYDVIKENHKFLWTESDAIDSWEQRLAKKYYDKLYKEYCICDLTFYRDNKIALRWRTEKEIVIGKGHFSCAEKKCTVNDLNCLKTWEVNFAYVENGEKKNALVKIRLCSECSVKLNYKTQKRQVRRLKRSLKKQEKTRTIKDGDGNDEAQKNEKKMLTSDSATGSSIVTVAEEPVETIADRENVWENLPNFDLTKSRESVVEDYLNDLFM